MRLSDVSLSYRVSQLLSYVVKCGAIQASL